ILGMVGTSMASILFYFLVKKAGILFGSLVTYGIPIVAVVWGLIYGESLEPMRMLMLKRGNIQKEMSLVGEEAAEGTELQTVTLFKLMKAFEKVMIRVHERQNRPVHIVIRYNYTMEGSRTYLLNLVQEGQTVAFEKVFDICEDRVHAIFLFLSILELAQQKYMKLMVGEGRNNFILEWNQNREDDLEPGYIEQTDSYETKFDQSTFSDAPEDEGDFEPSLN
ncbi:MAG: hypothetical protein ACKOGD_12700, partial [Sphingomonadales bacterium]